MADAPDDTPPTPEAGGNENPRANMSLASLMSHSTPTRGRSKSEEVAAKRRRCAELRAKGLTIAECMAVFDVSDETVRRWCREVERGDA